MSSCLGLVAVSCKPQGLWDRLWLMSPLFYLLNLYFWLLIPLGPAWLDSQYQCSVLLNLALGLDWRDFSVFQVEILILQTVGISHVLLHRDVALLLAFPRCLDDLDIWLVPIKL